MEHSTVSRDELQLEMTRELQREDVADWYTLGVMLNIPKRRLDIIEVSYKNLNRSLIELLCEWFHHDADPSWEKLGSALIETRCHCDQGISILKKYCPHVLNNYSLPPRDIPRRVYIPRGGDSNTEDIRVPCSTLPDSNMIPHSFYPSPLQQTPINYTNPHGPPYPYFTQGYPSFHSPYGESFHSLPRYHSANSSSHLPYPSFSRLRSPSHPFSRYGYPSTPSRIQPVRRPVVTEPVHDLNHSEQLIMKHKSTDMPVVTEPDQLHSDLTYGEQIIMEFKRESTDPSIPNELQKITGFDAVSESAVSLDHHKNGPLLNSLSNSLLPTPLPTVNVTHSNNKVLKSTGEVETLSKDHPLSFCSFHPSPNPSMTHTTSSLPAVQFQDLEYKEAILEQRKYCLNYSRLIGQFGDLKYDVQEIFEEDGISAKKIKKYLSCMKSSPVDVRNAFSFLDENSPELEKASSISEIFEFLNKYMSFDNCTLLESLVNRFVPLSDARTRLSEYNQCLEDFFQICPSEMLAMVIQQNLSESPHLNENSVSMHLDHTWQTRPAQHLKDFQQKEFHEMYIPTSALKTVTYEKRSIFIIWETTSKVIQELSKDCVNRFSHFRRLGVLQFIIGTLEMDFSTRITGPPEVFRIECQLTRASSKSALNGSMMTLESEQSHYSRKTGLSGESALNGSMMTLESEQSHYSRKTGLSGESGQTGESGYGSGRAPSMDNLPVATSYLPVPETVLDIYPKIEVLSSFSSITSGEKRFLSVSKGQKVRCLHTYGEWACVVSEDNKSGYIPSNILKMQTNTAISSKPLPYSPSNQTISEESISVLSVPLSTQMFVIVRRKVSLSELNISASVASTTSSEIERPDTPPILAQMEALEITLSSDRNSEAVDPFQNGQVISLKQEKSKENFVRFIDQVDTNSLPKSLAQDLYQYREEPESVPRTSLIKKLWNFFSRERRRGDSESEIRSLVSSKTQVTIGSETASKKSYSISRKKKDTQFQAAIVHDLYNLDTTTIKTTFSIELVDVILSPQHNSQQRVV